MIKKSYEIQKNLSNLINHNFFLLYGENNGLKKDIRNLIKTVTNKKNVKIENISIYENEILEKKDDFYNTIYSGSLFSDNKIITINNGTDKITKQIEEIVNKKLENVLIIIFADILEKKSKLRNFFEKNIKTLFVPCYADGLRDLEIITLAELKKNNIILSRECINLLIEKSNNDRDNLRNEINKIKGFAINKKNLSIDELRLLINFTGDYKSDDLINECLCGNITEYKKILSELYTNTINQIFLLRILSNKIQRLFNMKKVENDYNNLDNLLDATKPPIFWKEKPMVKKQLRVWNLNELNKVINEINNTELLCKKNPQISQAVFFNFFTKICKKANNYSL